MSVPLAFGPALLYRSLFTECACSTPAGFLLLCLTGDHCDAQPSDCNVSSLKPTGSSQPRCSQANNSLVDCTYRVSYCTARCCCFFFFFFFFFFFCCCCCCLILVVWEVLTRTFQKMLSRRSSNKSAPRTACQPHH